MMTRSDALALAAVAIRLELGAELDDATRDAIRRLNAAAATAKRRRCESPPDDGRA